VKSVESVSITMPKLLLAGDIGGTKTVLCALAREGDELRVVREQTYATQEAPALEAILDRFRGEALGESYAAAVFGVAGPVIDGSATLSNVAWRLETGSLERNLGLMRGKVALINDLEAMGYGVSQLSSGALETLNPGRPAPGGHGALLAAGTGLGVGMLVWSGARWRPLASEGGHTSFAPHDALEDDLLRFLRDELGGHVSNERILSGPGLWNIYRFLRDTERGEEFDWLRSRLEAAGDRSATVAQHGLSGEAPICRLALEIFVRNYGRLAGDLALTAMATGGVFLGGGIAPKILPALRWPCFMEGFTAKGRLGGLLEQIPVRVILDPRAPLLGAAHRAELLLEESS
jgi:glucokinase